MKKALIQFRDTLIAGIVFLLPILILFVLATKAVQLLTGFSSKIANLFGLKSIIGISGSNIVGTIVLLLLCLFCGFLVRVAFIKRIYKWVDDKLEALVPGYRVYREMAVSKLKEHEAPLPYKCSAFIEQDGLQTPCFVMATLPDGKIMIFIPTAGNVKEGTVYATTAEKIRKFPGVDMKQYQLVISNLGLGMGELLKQHQKTL